MPFHYVLFPGFIFVTAWKPIDIPTVKTDFVEGLKTIAGSGDPTLREGMAVHLYAANCSMTKKAFVSNDGDFLIVPSQGRLDIQTEFGKYVLLLILLSKR
jgi:homogentisate 1,2-dioxygenase